MHQLILASTSPRRRQILERCGYKFHTRSVKVSEIPNKNLNLHAQIQDLASQKANSLVASDKSLKQQRNLILSADTVVVFDGEILGKPKSREQAFEFLNRLSGQKHEVITGVCLIETSPDFRECAFHESTIVEFRDLSQAEIEAYINLGTCFDKAGGYGIQDEAGEFVAEISGSFDNVVGLPSEKLAEVLAEQNWRVEKID